MPAMLLPLLLALAPLAVASAGGAAAAASTLPAAVWPAPRSAHCAPGAGPALSKVLALKLTGAGAGSAIAANATARYLPLLTEHAAPSGGVASATIAVADANETLGQGTDYSYTIKVVGNTITATAASPYGVAYALETLSQFLDATGRLQCTALAVDDAPAFVHRGIMIDTGRRYYPVALVKQTIEGMAMTRQNILHFHLSEECFRVQSDVYPQLTASCVVGSHNNTAFYTKADISDIVSFARERGVRVLPEFDMPGHSGGFCTSLASAGLKCCGGQIEDDPAGASVKIISKILSEMAALFPDEVMNIGSDETGSAAPCTLANTKSFEVAIIEHLIAIGKTPMGAMETRLLRWEEILFKTAAAAAFKSVIVDSWARTSWSQAAEAGHKVVMSNSGLFYLDSAGHSAQNMWLNISARAGNATAAQAALLLGGETSMWQDRYVGSCLFPNEQDDNFTESVNGCIWPRAAIAAGSFWGYYNSSKTLDEATFNATHQRLLRRGIASCPCATLTETSHCSQLQRCEKTYCPPPPPPPPPPACGKGPKYTCLFAVPCDASDPDQEISFDNATGQLKSASGLCADAGAACKAVSILTLAKCDPNSKTQRWTHSAQGKGHFASVGCAHQCIDCFYGGTGNAGLYACDGSTNQDWEKTGKTFGEDYAGHKCMSQAPRKP